RPSAGTTAQSSTLMQDDDHPLPRWATIVRQPYSPPAGGTHPAGFGWDEGDVGYAGYTADPAYTGDRVYVGDRGYRDGPDRQYQDAIELQGDERHEAPGFYHQRYSDYPRPP